MTREEAIRKLQKQKAEYLEEWVDFSGVAKAYDMAIEALSSADRPTEWISVSERLPEKNGYYLVSMTNGINNDLIEITYYMKGMWHKGSCIEAWMSLPEPYREEREEYELATEQMEHDTMYEPTYNSEDGSM